MSDFAGHFWQSVERLDSFYRSLDLHERFAVLWTIQREYGESAEAREAWSKLDAAQQAESLPSMITPLVHEAFLFSGISSFVEAAESLDVDSTPLLEYLDRRQGAKLRDALQAVRRTLIRAGIKTEERYEIDLTAVIAELKRASLASPEPAPGGSILVSEAADDKHVNRQTITNALDKGDLDEVEGSVPRRVVLNEKYNSWKRADHKVRDTKAAKKVTIPKPRVWFCENLHPNLAAFKPAKCDSCDSKLFTE